MPRNKHKQQGHYCWSCDRRRANERFTGKGHARHLCRDCARLGAAELACRQAVRDLERCVIWDGIIPRKRRRTVERFLKHRNPRVRNLAAQMWAEDVAARARLDAERLLEEELIEQQQFSTAVLADFTDSDEDERYTDPLAMPRRAEDGFPF